MKRSLGMKLVAIAVLVVALMIGLLLIESTVTERASRRDGVVKEIAQSSSLAQHLVGPIVVVPFERTVQEWHEDAAGGRRAFDRQVKGTLQFLPETFQLDGEMPTERRARGIYETRLYHANARIRATFQIPVHYGVDAGLTSYRFGQPSISLGISDIRGIEKTSKVLVNETPVKLLPGTGSALLGAGLRAPLANIDGDGATQLDFALDLSIQGTSELHVVPVGRETRISLSSDWASPSFIGQYLPVHRQIGPGGFSAQWFTSFFSTNLEETLRRCGDSVTACADFQSRELGVSLVNPVDQYLQTERATKYALLFISLTFAGFFLFEVLKKLAVHPIQYGLVGAALALFFLLLLSMAEHIGFGMAYLISATACIGLIGFYVAGILRSVARGMGFACALAMLYGTLYVLVSADDYALLMGSALLFGLLAAVMVLTRKVDWFSLGRQDEYESSH